MKPRTDTRLYRLVPVEACEVLPPGDYVVAVPDGRALPSSRIQTPEPVPVAHLIAHFKALLEQDPG